MRLLLLHPEVAFRDCQDCVRHVYQPNGERLTRFGLPVVRPAGQKPPCNACPKIAREEFPAPWNAGDLSHKNQRAYRHYLECKAVCRWPDDGIVRRNAALIRQVEEAVTEQRQDRREGRRLEDILSLFSRKQRG